MSFTVFGKLNFHWKKWSLSSIVSGFPLGNENLRIEILREALIEVLANSTYGRPKSQKGIKNREIMGVTL